MNQTLIDTLNDMTDQLWVHSRFFGNLLGKSVENYKNKDGISAIVTLFTLLEYVAQSKLNDNCSSLNQLFNKLFNFGVIDSQTHSYLNTGKDCIREIRNRFAHRNLSLTFFKISHDSEFEYPLDENVNCLILFEHLSPWIVHSILEICLNSVMDESSKLLPKHSNTNNCISKHMNLEFGEYTIEELCVQKGIDSKRIEALDIPLNEKIRLVSNASGIDQIEKILSRLKL